MAEPTERRHAEIAGAGLGGLTAAVALAQRGWSVRVHERAEQIRATGSGIYIAENGIRVLEAVGAREGALRDGCRFYWRETRDHRNQVIALAHWPPEARQRIYVLAREVLVQALLDVAVGHGVELRLSSRVRGADPEGALVLEGGERLPADLVIGADGVGSPVRESLGIPGRRRSLRGGAIRAIVPRRPDDADIPADTYAEFWTGMRRVFYAPISPTETYLALMTLDKDKTGTREPPDLETWSGDFPYIRHMIERIRDPLAWAPFAEVKLQRWSRGRVALIGDAAHAMAPNLGQGGGTAMMDGLSIAHHVSRPGVALAEALDRWEARERPVVDRTQLISYIYGSFCDWPILPRNIALWLAGRSRWANRQRFIAANFVPDGADEPPGDRVFAGA
ncbi:MAG: FAD-dependent monooxygenase [Alphaproteobacteria bacterium]|nr:FAD-dependent monooxygenase [Alphaproteobacteria bacterium]